MKQQHKGDNMQEKRALGRGLSSLIPLGGGRSDPEDANMMMLAVEDIVPNQNQPRKLFDKSAIDELAASIEEKGVLQPIIVRELGGGKYELVAGERRFRACQQLHLEKIPVIVKDVKAQESLEIALIENLQRQDLNPVEEALAYKELLGKYQYTQDELAKRLGRDRSSIANTLRLLKLPDNIRSYIIAGNISMGHARAILGIESSELQEKVAEEIVKSDLSVREIENWVRRLKGEEGEEAGDGREGGKEPKSLAPQIGNPLEYKNLEENLKKALKTKVIIKSKGQKGKIIVHFSTKEELDDLYTRLKGVDFGDS